MKNRIDTAEQILRGFLHEMADRDGRIFIDTKLRLKGHGAGPIEKLLARAHDLLNTETNTN